MTKKLLFVILVITCLSAGMTDAYAGDHKTPAYAGYKELPSWFFNPNGAIGVSDMALDSVTAVNQAVIRALFMHAISKNLNMSSVYELYYHIEKDGKNNIDDQKSHCLAEFETKITGYGFDIIDVFITRYREAVVLLNVYDDFNEEVVKTADFKGSYMFYYDGTIRYPEYGDALILQMSTPDEVIKDLEWKANTEGLNSFQTSKVDTVTYKVIERYYYYGKGGKAPKSAVNQNTRHGLWHCLADTFMQALTNFTPQQSIIKSTNRMITDFQSINQNADYRDKVQDIVRMTYKASLSCKIKKMECENGMFYVDWEVSEHNRTKASQLSGGEYSYESNGYQAIVGYDNSKARNESRRIALISAENEIAKMANFRISGIADEFSVTQDDDYYQRYCDTAQISTKLMIKDAQEIKIAEPELKNGVYCSKIKVMINENNIIQMSPKE